MKEMEDKERRAAVNLIAKGVVNYVFAILCLIGGTVFAVLMWTEVLTTTDFRQGIAAGLIVGGLLTSGAGTAWSLLRLYVSQRT